MNEVYAYNLVLVSYINFLKNVYCIVETENYNSLLIYSRLILAVLNLYFYY